MSETYTPKQLRAILTEHGITNCEWPDCEQPAAELAHIVSTGMGGRKSAHTLGNVFMACATHARNSDGLPGEGQTATEMTHERLRVVRKYLHEGLFRWDLSAWHLQEALRRHLAATRPKGLT